MKSFTSTGSGFYGVFKKLLTVIHKKNRRHIKRGEIMQCKQIQAISHRPQVNSLRSSIAFTEMNLLYDYKKGDQLPLRDN